MLRSRTLEMMLALGALGLFAGGSTALAQTSDSSFPPSLNTEQNPLRHVSAGALAERSPGNLVSAGVARTLAAADFGRSVIEITERPPGPDPKAIFLAEAVEEIFNQINRALLLFENVLRLRAGLDPRTPIDLSMGGTATTVADELPSQTDGA